MLSLAVRKSVALSCASGRAAARRAAFSPFVGRTPALGAMTTSMLLTTTTPPQPPLVWRRKRRGSVVVGEGIPPVPPPLLASAAERTARTLTNTFGASDTGNRENVGLSGAASESASASAIHTAAARPHDSRPDEEEEDENENENDEDEDEDEFDDDDDNDGNDDNDGEDFVVWHGQQGSKPPTATERIIEAWVGASSPPPADVAESSSTPTGDGGFSPDAPVDVLLPSAAAYRSAAAAASSAASLVRALEWCRHAGGMTLADDGDDETGQGREQAVPKPPAVVSARALNAVLEALGRNANAIHPFDGGALLDAQAVRTAFGAEEPFPSEDGGDGAGEVELVARRIVRLLLQACDESAETTADGQPDPSLVPKASTFNAYIECMSRPTTMHTANAAEQLLRDMIDGKSKLFDWSSGEGRRLPPPNVDTYNAVMAKWALVSQEPALRYEKINMLYNMLEQLSSSSPPHQQSLRPNRRTFLIALSHLADYGSSGGDRADAAQGIGESISDFDSFSADEARVWINRMAKMADRYVDDTLRPDTMIYNAPLRWSGAPHQRLPLPVAKWDDLDHMFHAGFQKTTADGNSLADRRTRDAKCIEEWLLDMEEACSEDGRLELAPNVETYESVIQAWVRTGTLEGLLRAESWAMRALAAASPGALESEAPGARFLPRLQTFHPIIAAWANSGDERGPGRVLEWIRRLDGSERALGLQADGRMRAAPTLAWRKYQRALLKMPSSNGSERENHYPVESNGLSFPDSNSSLNHDETLNRETDIASASDGIDLVKWQIIPSSASLTGILSAARECMICLENLCSEWRSSHHSAGKGTAFFLESNTFAHVVNAWGDAARLCAADEAASERSAGNSHRRESTRYALSEMFRAVQLYDETIEMSKSFLDDSVRSVSCVDEHMLTSDAIDKHTLQLLHLLQTNVKVCSNALEHVRALDSNDLEKTIGNFLNKSLGSDKYFLAFFPQIERMLRRSLEIDLFNSQAQDFFHGGTSSWTPVSGGRFDAENIMYADTFSYESNEMLAFPSIHSWKENSRTNSNDERLLAFCRNILQGCQNLNQPDACGDAVRATMLIFDHVTSTCSNLSQQKSIEKSLTQLVVHAIKVIGAVVANPHEKTTLLKSVYTRAKTCFDEKGDASNSYTEAIDLKSVANALNECGAGQIPMDNLREVHKKSLPRNKRRFVRRLYRSVQSSQ